jgi:hypothetical protein
MMTTNNDAHGQQEQIVETIQLTVQIIGSIFKGDQDRFGYHQKNRCDNNRDKKQQDHYQAIESVHLKTSFEWRMANGEWQMPAATHLGLLYNTNGEWANCKLRVKS